ncbi:flagellar basal body-associated protein FliL [Pseudomonas sp. CFBP 8770]|uniref:flagellar basal body-associated protein FliL n=1 Tax=unclassified Pseudomonas TaxID=196821 RepID=UPI00177FA28E|nr:MULTISPECIES: flagellar basal body-associated protein FliL [unclassified Pseudomonas]MBD8473596.1 flagellar basal body-associated protein FliL [Pseudomonas sp. CFBP 8773]MBD8646723.1 flagellar basal body-associated protein FliL [Pseudomonas sp. CFBP 8770]
MAKTEEAKEPAAKEGKGKLKLIILLVVGLLLAIGLSVGATWFLMHKPAEAPADKTPADAAHVKPAAIYEPLTPAFVVNFKQNGRDRYMQVSIVLQARDKADMDALKVHTPVIRNNLVMLFSGQPFETLTTPIGQEMLRQKATASVQEVAQKEVGKPVIDQVLFTNFVLQ